MKIKQLLSTMHPVPVSQSNKALKYIKYWIDCIEKILSVAKLIPY
jgi:hypothetical protein